MSALDELAEFLPNFEVRSFISGAAYAVAIMGEVVLTIYILPLLIRSIKSLIEKIIFSIRNRNSPPSGENK